MARSIHHFIQSPITCDICDSPECVDSHCLGCKGNMCTTCEASHTKARMFRHHKIVPIIDGLKLQAAEEKCNTHSSHVYSFYCNICQIPVCNKCITGDHKGHDINAIETGLQNVQREIKEYYETLETKYLSQYKEEVAKLAQSIAVCRKVTMSVKTQINDSRTVFITEVNKICDDMVHKAVDEEKRQISDMEKTLQNFHDNIKEIEQLMVKSKEALTNRSSEQITFNQKKPSLTHLDVQTVVTQNPPAFISGQVDKTQIAQQIGNLMIPQGPHKTLTENDINVSIIHRNTLGKGIRSVNAVDSNHAWVSEPYPEKGMRLIAIDGQEVKRFATEFVMTDFVLTELGDIVATYFNGRCIGIMTQTGQVTQTINTNPYHPSGVCLGRNGQWIVVCVNTPDKSSSKLVMYSKAGKEIRTIKYTDKAEGKYAGQRVTQNYRGDYCVAHRDHNKVYIVDGNGALRYTYDGSGAWKMKEFWPCDICSDIYNNLFISDGYNNSIHMLDNGTKFLRFLLTEQNGITKPFGLCIDKDGRLWVGQHSGELCIVKYLK